MAAKKQLMKPATQKVVKDAKPTEVEPRVISDEEYRCTCCGHKYKKHAGSLHHADRVWNQSFGRFPAR